MVPTNSFSAFLQNNDLEFRSLVISVCDSLNFSESSEDVVQDLYLKFLTSKIIESFDEHFRNKNTKMTTYLYPIIRNYVVSKLKSNEYRFFKQNLRNYEPSDDIDDLDLVLCHNPVAVDYINQLLHNESSDGLSGFGSQFRFFERQLEQSQKKRKNEKKYLKKHKYRETDFLNELKQELAELKCRNIDLDDPEYREISFRVENAQSTTGCTLIDIFILMYRGYSGRQIAKIYGVSDMSITNVKYKLAEAMFNYGIKPAKKKEKNGRAKMSKMPIGSGNRRL